MLLRARCVALVELSTEIEGVAAARWGIGRLASQLVGGIERRKCGRGS
jgi:hypothetical protein